MRDEQMKALSDRLAAIQANDTAILARVAAMRQQCEGEENAELQMEHAIRRAMQAILEDVANDDE